MKILVTNDDGYTKEGIKRLVKEAMKYGECIVVAPMKEQSGKSHSLCIREEMAFKQVEDIIPGVKTYYLDSTPADCVRVAHYYLKYDFDIVFSGINNGYNLGEDITYSGTCAAVTESCFLNKKGIAVSCDRGKIDLIDNELEQAIKYVFDNKLLDYGNLYNINLPINSKGIRYTSQGHIHYDTCYFKQNDGVILGGYPTVTEDDVLYSDMQAIYEGYISITPLNYNRTDNNVLSLIINHKNKK